MLLWQHLGQIEKNNFMNINEVKTYKAIILFNEIMNNGRKFKTVMNGDDKILEPLFIDLLAKNYLVINGDSYNTTEEGEKVFYNFMKKYKEYLKIYDIYSLVDLDKGEFAFEKFYDFTTDAQWDAYKNDQRFFDVRIPVAKFKKMNPSEIVFMSFINENRFDTSSTGWQFDLMADNIWMEIDDICRSAIMIEDLGEDVLENMIKRGTEVMMELMKKEIEINKQKLEEAKATAGNVDDEYVVETTTIIEEYEEDLVYYDPYWDPWYCSPIWYVPLFIW